MLNSFPGKYDVSLILKCFNAACFLGERNSTCWIGYLSFHTHFPKCFNSSDTFCEPYWGDWPCLKSCSRQSYKNQSRIIWVVILILSCMLSKFHRYFFIRLILQSRSDSRVVKLPFIEFKHCLSLYCWIIAVVLQLTDFFIWGYLPNNGKKSWKRNFEETTSKWRSQFCLRVIQMCSIWVEYAANFSP